MRIRASSPPTSHRRELLPPALQEDGLVAVERDRQPIRIIREAKRQVVAIKLISLARLGIDNTDNATPLTPTSTSGSSVWMPSSWSLPVGSRTTPTIASGDSPTDQDDAVAEFGLYDLVSTVERTALCVRVYRSDNAQSTRLRLRLSEKLWRPSIAVCEWSLANPTPTLEWLAIAGFDSDTRAHLGRRGITRHSLRFRP
jgi:hypothetical protein